MAGPKKTAIPTLTATPLSMLMMVVLIMPVRMRVDFGPVSVAMGVLLLWILRLRTRGMRVLVVRFIMRMLVLMLELLVSMSMGVFLLCHRGRSVESGSLSKVFRRR
jgi:hypothetical protein